MMPGVAYLYAGGDSKDARKVRGEILKEAERLVKEGIDEEFYQQVRKASFGANLRGLNSFENLCVEQAQAYFEEQDPWTFPEIYDTMTRQDAEEFIRTWFRIEQMTLTVIRPGEEPA